LYTVRPEVPEQRKRMRQHFPNLEWAKKASERVTKSAGKCIAKSEGMNLFQILITDVPNEKLPHTIAHSIEKLVSLYPDANYRMLHEAEIRDTLASSFGPEVLAAYERLNPYAYRSDLARYCFLYLFGGLYVDVGISFHARIPLPKGATFFAFRDANLHARKSWAVSNGIIYAEKGHPILAKAIQRVVENCQTEYYGMTPLCPTGPTLLGRVVCEEDSDTVCCYGEFLTLTPNLAKKNRAFVMDDGTIVAFPKPGEGGDLKSLGVQGTNNYNNFWHARKVYHSSATNGGGWRF
jgi:mannosyltransferase OCH1-like enzyme